MADDMSNETTENIRRFGNFHDCRIANMSLNFKDETIELDLPDVLRGVRRTDDYIPGPGKIRFTGVDDISLPKVTVDDDYIFSIKIGGGTESSQAELVIGNGREMRFTFQGFEVWKGDSRLA